MAHFPTFIKHPINNVEGVIIIDRVRRDALIMAAMKKMMLNY